MGLTLCILILATFLYKLESILKQKIEKNKKSALLTIFIHFAQNTYYSSIKKQEPLATKDVSHRLINTQDWRTTGKCPEAAFSSHCNEGKHKDLVNLVQSSTQAVLQGKLYQEKTSRKKSSDVYLISFRL